ncbi:YceI family protein [Nocardioides donggukensis]|uniref:YceI family protein n=1 Tax=Nocardioides donggukensis TaxID=2774019 RepID=A0A927Q029_9ACTN|nr:YceI family protein [Nocardioides donggukensis]MBD8871093.1 YceI family protein [Nocardioides donggukensis]
MSIFSRTKTEAPDTEGIDTEGTEGAQSGAVADLTGEYTLDPTHTRIGFSARHAMVTTVRGSFATFDGAARIDAQRPADSSVELAIDVASIDTGVADRDGHLRSGDFLDVEQFPRITFVSTAVEREGESTWLVTGDLTIKDVTRPVTVPFEATGSARDPFGNVRVGFEGEVSVNRKDWGLTWNAALETGGVLISEKVKLSFDVSAIRNA